MSDDIENTLGQLGLLTTMRMQPGIRAINFPAADGSVAVRIMHSDPPTIWVNPDLAWDAAAKQFWNACYRIMGRPGPFPDL